MSYMCKIKTINKKTNQKGVEGVTMGGKTTVVDKDRKRT